MTNRKKTRLGEASFTLFETVIALAIMGSMLVELMNVQGNTIYFNEYAININKSMWLAKRVMSQVEYYWQTRPFSELKFEGRDEITFEDFPDYKYKLQVVDWKLPIIDLVTGGMGGGGDEGQGEEKPEAGSAESKGIADMIKQQLGDELLKVANVEVSWAEGAKRNSVGLTYLLTNQKILDEKLALLKDVSVSLEQKTGTPAAGNPSTVNPIPGQPGSGTQQNPSTPRAGAATPSTGTGGTVEPSN